MCYGSNSANYSKCCLKRYIAREVFALLRLKQLSLDSAASQNASSEESGRVSYMKKAVGLFIFLSPFLFSCAKKEETKSTDKAKTAEASTTAENVQRAMKNANKPRPVLDFTATIKGGPLDGQVLHGIKKKGDLNANASGSLEGEKAFLEFRNMTLEKSQQMVGLRIDWKGDATPGTKEVRYGADGSKKFGNTGSLGIWNKGKDFDFSRINIQFKEAVITVNSLGPWEKDTLGLSEFALIEGEVVVSETKTEIYENEEIEPKSKIDTITLTIQYKGRIGRKI